MLTKPLNEIDVKKELAALAKQNINILDNACFLGAGAYNHWVPSTVDHLIGRAEFYTAYTPYQPEVSQGTLQSIFEFQSWMCKLTGLEVANASLYDGATAVAEAALMVMRLNKRNTITLANALNPAYLQVLETYLEPHGAPVSAPLLRPLAQSAINHPPPSGGMTEAEIAGWLTPEVAAVIIQQPSFYGEIMSLAELKAVSKQAHADGSLVIACVDPLSLAVLPKPSEYDADIVVGEGQALGIHLNYGGPYLGFMVCKEEYLRQMPGRIVGETVDEIGKRAFVLTMQTREQHIRREKATSNICSNEALCALAATVYLSLLGEAGLKEVADKCKQQTDKLKKLLGSINGIEILTRGETFKEFAIRISNLSKLPAGEESVVKFLNNKLLEKNIVGGYELAPDQMLIAVTEMISDDDLESFAKILQSNCA